MIHQLSKVSFVVSLNHLMDLTFVSVFDVIQYFLKGR